MSVPPTRRERLRAATVDEIYSVARRLLADEGLAAVTLRAISREMGMTAPALYRYFPSLDDLLCGLCAAFYDEVTRQIEAQVAAVPDDDVTDRMYTACRALRIWSTAHPAEFTMMFGGVKARMGEDHPELHAAGMRFAGVFIRLFVAMWERSGLRVPADDEIAAPLREQFAAFLTEHRIPLPVGAMQVFMSAWIRLYGMIALEIFGHLHFCMTDGDAMFETELADIARQLGLPARRER